VAPLIGVLALQGGFHAHARILDCLGAEVREVRVPSDLADVEGLIIPGGESTTMTLGMQREGLTEPLRRSVADGLPVLGTCAGMIMLDRAHLGMMDIRTERNAFGRQVRSFESEVAFMGIEGGPVRAVFIRAPWIVEHGADVTVLAVQDGHPVAAEQGPLLAVAFHPELAGELRIHQRFLERVRRPGVRPKDAGAPERLG